MRRRLFSIASLALVAACGEKKPPPKPAAPPAPPPPPPRPAPVTQTLLDGRVVVELSGLRYAVKAPRDWVSTAYWSTDNSGGKDDVFVIVTPPGQPRTSSADVFVSLEAFIKNDRAPNTAAKLANIAEQRKQRHPEFSIVRQAPVPLANRKRAELYILGHNPSGDTEAIAFIDEGPVVAEMMLLGRSRAQFDQALPLFRELVQSYGKV